jgi:hypothetical protein
MAYTGQIYFNGNPITIQQAIDLNLISQDADGNIWLTQDSFKAISISGDLHLTG